MDIEYHFYITYIIALRAGFDKDTAYKIAYSSQYTDDNNRELLINKDEQDEYEVYISQTMNILKPIEELIRIHPLFHFFPGTSNEILNCSTPRRDGKLHLLNTTPGNLNAQKLMKASLKSNNPCRIGIATHTFVDTYSHQNFAGIKDEFNGMKGFFKGLIPNIGHADAGYNPDRPALKWEDDRLSSTHKMIDNKARFSAASKLLYKYYRLHVKPKYSEKNLKREQTALQKEIDLAIGRYDKNNRREGTRIKRYKRLIGDDLVEDYNKRSWFKLAVQRKRKKVIDITTDKISYEFPYYWKENYKKSDWYMFQEAVKAQQELGESILEPVFQQMEFTSIESW